MTLISVYNSEGCVGRCDAKCYNAAYPYCDCICGGKNHGVGRDKAVETTRELADEMIEKYCGETGIDPKMIKVNNQVKQLPLF